jgi:hypothetical protein
MGVFVQKNQKKTERAEVGIERDNVAFLAPWRTIIRVFGASFPSDHQFHAMDHQQLGHPYGGFFAHISQQGLNEGRQAASILVILLHDDLKDSIDKPPGWPNKPKR